jgi:hypothetical protein
MSMRRRLDCKILVWVDRKQMYDGSKEKRSEDQGTTYRHGSSRRLQNSSKNKHSKCA